MRIYFSGGIGTTFVRTKDGKRVGKNPEYHVQGVCVMLSYYDRDRGNEFGKRLAKIARQRGR